MLADKLLVGQLFTISLRSGERRVYVCVDNESAVCYIYARLLFTSEMAKFTDGRYLIKRTNLVELLEADFFLNNSIYIRSWNADTY